MENAKNTITILVFLFLTLFIINKIENIEENQKVIIEHQESIINLELAYKKAFNTLNK